METEVLGAGEKLAAYVDQFNKGIGAEKGIRSSTERKHRSEKY